MFRFPTRRLSIALLAQVVFCLVAAPVIAAQQWAALPLPANDDAKDAPRETRVTIQAAFDASNVRPEEVSDAEQKKGRSRGGVNRTGGNRAGETDRDAVGSALADAFAERAVRAYRETFVDAPSTIAAHPERVRQGGPCEGFFVARVSNPCFGAERSRVENPCHNVLRRSLRDQDPAFQPTGPPTT